MGSSIQTFDALILAAGFGTRLRPWTEHVPKPLIPFFGAPLIDLALKRCENTAVETTHVNTHHLGEKMSQHLDDKKHIRIHHETEILGTGGPVAKIHRLVGAKDLVIYNGDCISHVDLKNLVQYHQDQKNDATMVLLPTCLPGKNPVFCQNEKVAGIGSHDLKDEEVSRHTFTGIHVLSPRFRELIPGNGFQDIRDAYKDSFRKGYRVGRFIYKGLWADLGEPKDYWLAHEKILGDKDGMDTLQKLGVPEVLKSLNPDRTIHNSFGSHAPRYFEWCSDQSGGFTENPDMFVNISGEKIKSSASKVIINALTGNSELNIKDCMIVNEASTLTWT